MTETGYIEHALGLERERYTPVFELDDLPPLVTLELQLFLQRRHDDSRSGRLAPHPFSKLVRACQADKGLVSLYAAGEDFFDAFLAVHPAYAEASVGRDVWRHLKLLHRRLCAREVWDEDVWPHGELPHTELDPHPVGMSWAGIEQPWLKDLAKRWGRYRLTTLGLSSKTVAMDATTFRKFSVWAGDQLSDPELLTRALLEDFATYLSTGSNSNRARTIQQIRVFLNGVRQLQWEPRIPANATYLTGEGGRQRQPAPRFNQTSRSCSRSRILPLSTGSPILVSASPFSS